MDIAQLNDWITLALGFISGGGLTTVFLLPSKRKKEEVSVVQEVQNTYKQIIKDLTEDREQWREQVNELNAKVDKLEAEAEKRDRKITELQQELDKYKRGK